MTDPDEALRLILERASVLGPETAALAEAVDRVLASDLRAREALPPFDNSAMDGYAVRAADLKDASRRAPAELEVREVVRAGAAGELELEPGEAARIMTGAPLPRGADSVVMVELTSPGAPGRVRFAQPAAPGKHVRARGEDVSAGSLLLEKGALLRPYEVALLAAQGITEVPVVRRPVAAVLATGDELLPASQGLSRGKIRDSNGPAVRAALSRWGVPTRDLGIVADEPGALRAALEAAFASADAVLVSGGVSAGDFDHTRAVLSELGVTEVFWRVAIKPGKPLFFGVRRGPGGAAQLVFGLPGNPVAALVCVEEFARPALEKLGGLAPKHASYHLRGRALDDYPKPQERRQYLFCVAVPGPEGYELRVIRPQGSALLGMPARANALALAPLGTARVRRGESLAFRWLK